MDYGPFLTSTLEVDRDVYAFKSIAIRLDEGLGGVSQGRAFVSFDTDTLRYAAAWSGPGLMDWRNVVFDGSHNTHPAVVGTRWYVNPEGPGWGDPRSGGSFADTRQRGADDRAYGPLDSGWGRFQGLYRHGQQVVLCYRIGTTDVLDLPGLQNAGGQDIFSRTLELGPRDSDLVLQVARVTDTNVRVQQLAGAAARPLRVAILARDMAGATADNSAQADYYSFDGQSHLVVERADRLDLTAQDFTITARVRTQQDGTIFAKTAPEGPWVRDGKTLFVRGGRLCYDIGWVGDVASRRRVDDNQWHGVAATFSADTGTLQLYVDGQLQAERVLRPREPVRGHVARIGYTAANFPRPTSALTGDLQFVRFYQRQLTPEELGRESQQAAPGVVTQWQLGALSDGQVLDSAGGASPARLVQGDRPATQNLAVAVVGLEQPQWLVAPGGMLQLRVPQGRNPLRFKLLFAHLETDLDLQPLLSAVQSGAPISDLSALTRGAASLWPETLETEVTRLDESSDGTFVAETLTIPQQNPWRSWMRLGGFDFLADGDSAILASWQGDVWKVSGLRDRAGRLQWRRIASGLFQPLGVKVVGSDTIYILGRDQITRLHDVNGDGESDFYECFHHQMQVTEHFHEFAMDLQTDEQGNFYYMKAARHALPALVSQHGTLIRVSADGEQATILARGFRAPDGLLVNGDGTFFSSDQEGHWTPMNRINWVREGGYYGNMMAANPQQVGDDATDPPVVWIHRAIDRSPTAQVWVPEGQWGSLSGSLLSLSYGTGKTFRVLTERCGDLMQGGIVQLPIPEFPTGIQRGRFHPVDGQLYLCGLFGWSSDKTLAGGFYRVRATGQPLRSLSGLAARKAGLWLEFTVPLDAQTAGDLRRYVVSRWNYRRTANYGSDDYRVSDGKPGRDLVKVTAVSVSEDRRSVFLHIDEMVPCMQMRVQYRIRDEQGDALAGSVDHTIHLLPELDSPLRARFANQLQPKELPDVPPLTAEAPELRPGLALTITARRENGRDDRVVRTPALLVAAGQRPALRVAPGPFVAEWMGYIQSELPDRVSFQARVSGALQVRVNGQEVLASAGGYDSQIAGHEVELRAGLNKLVVRLRSHLDGAAALRLFWQRGDWVQEQLRPDLLVHEVSSSGPLADSLHWRNGRELWAQLRCARCHASASGERTMPELALELPVLEGVGSRLQGAWLGQWIQNPPALRNDITMPHVLEGSSETEVADITAYLLTLRDREAAGEATADASAAAQDDELVEQGLFLYEDLGCIACHHFENPDFEDPYQRTTLRFVGAKYRPGTLIQFLRNPQQYYSARRMPNFTLTAEEAAALAAYLRDASSELPGPSLPTGDTVRGQRAFTDRGCAACHLVDPTGELPAADRTPLSDLVRLQSGCLASDESQRNGAPNYLLTTEQFTRLRSFLAERDQTYLDQSSAPEAAQRLISRLRCNVCHRRDGQLPTLPEILAEEGEQGHPAESLPPLTWSGEKLQHDWVRQLLAGQLDYSVRPWKRGRMATFPAYAQVLADGLALQHGVGTDHEQYPAPSAAEVRIGQQLTQQNQGFHCLQCHGLPNQPPEAPFESRGVDFQLVPKRLRTEFYHRWIGNPIQFDTSVPMPRFSPDGKSTPITTTFRGDARRQFAAIWQYLRSLDE